MKGLIVAAALSVMTFAAAGTASAAPAAGHLNGVSNGTELLQTVAHRHRHARRHHHRHRHHSHKKRRHCTIKIGRRICVMR